MKLESKSFSDGQPIPGEFAFCIPHAQHHVCLGGNHNPHLRWSDVPIGTRSFALICHDPDVPSSGDDVNQEGRSVPADLPRVDFFHWVLTDISAMRREIRAGEFCSEVTPRGKPGPASPEGSRHGINDYTGWFAGDAQMKGNYFGYDGPCPPWNDSIDAILTILPPVPCAMNWRATAWHMKKVAFTLMSMTSSHSFSVKSTESLRVMMPALFTRMSIRP